MFKIDLGRDKIMGIHVRCVIRQLTKGMEYTDSSHWNDIFQNVFNPKQVRVFGSTMAISG